MIFGCHSSSVSLIPFPPPKFRSSVTYPPQRFNFLFPFLEFTTELWLELKIFSLRQARANYTENTQAVCGKGILSMNKWLPELRRLGSCVQKAPHLAQRQLKRFVLRRCRFTQDTGTGRRALPPRFKRKRTVQLSDSANDRSTRD